MSDDDAILAASAKLPIEEQISHKQWKARKQGYIFMLSQLQGEGEEDSALHKQVARHATAMVSDVNQGAQDAACETVIRLLEVCDSSSLGETPARLAKSLTLKAFKCRPSVVKKSTEIFLLLIEHDSVADVMPALVAAFSDKVAKVAQAALSTVLVALQLFGARVVLPKLFVEGLVPVFGGKDATSRATAQSIVVELARWVPPSSVQATILSKLRDAQRQDIEALIQELPGDLPVPDRLTRTAKQTLAAQQACQQSAPPAQTNSVASASDSKAQLTAAPAEEIDLFEPVDVLAKVPKSFWSQVEQKKWNERRDALVELKECLDVPKAIPGSIHELSAVLKRVIGKDSNACCVTEACACVAKLAKCMRKHFGSFVKGIFFSMCLEKLKDKSSAVRANAYEAIENMHRYSTPLNEVSDAVITALGSPSPMVKQMTLQWLSGAVEHEGAAEAKKLHPMLLPHVAKACSDGAPDVRDAAVAVAAAFARLAGSLSALGKHIVALDDRRRKLVEDAMTGESADSRSTTPVSVRSPQQAKRPGVAASGAGHLSTSAAKPAAAPSRPGTAALRPGTAASRSKTTTTKGSGAAPGAPESAQLQATNLSKDAAEEFLAETYGAVVFSQLGETVWKARLEAVDTILNKVESLGVEDVGVRTCMALAYVPGWKDSNFQVISKICQVCAKVAQGVHMSKADAASLITGMHGKLSDAKIQPHAFDMLSSLSEVVTLKTVMSVLHPLATKHKSPRVWVASISWMITAVADFGVSALDKKASIGYCTEMLTHTNPGVREGGTEFAAILHSLVGKEVEDVLTQALKPAMMVNVRERFAKEPPSGSGTVRQERRRKAAAGAARSANGAAPNSRPMRVTEPSCEPDDVADLGEERPSDAMMDLEPRVDISPQLTDALLSRFTEPKWNDRKAAVDAVEGILRSARHHIEPAVGGLVGVLKKAMNDSNRNVAAAVIRLCASLCSSIGGRFASTGRALVAPIIKAASDMKPAVQSAVAEFASTYIMQCGWGALGDACGDTAVLTKASSQGKAILLASFVALAGGSHPPVEDRELAVVLAAALCGLEDKGAEPRKLAGELLAHLAAGGAATVPQSVARDMTSAQVQLLKDKLGAAQPAGLVPPRSRGTSAAPPVGRTASRPGAAAARPGTASRSGVRPGAGYSEDGTRGSGHGEARQASGSGSSRRASLDRGGRPGRRESRERNVSRTPQPRRGCAAAAAAALDEAAGEPLITLCEPGDKDERKVVVRSFKFEARIGEAKLLQGALAPLLSPALAELMFSDEFKKHCQACDQLSAALPNLLAEMESVLDLLLRWAVLRFLEERQQAVVRVQALTAELLTALGGRGYQATDNEANAFLPCLCEKVGHNQERVRGGYVKLLSLFRAIYSPHRFIVFLLEGMESKNMKSRADCCAQLADTLEESGVAILHGRASKRTAGALKRLAAAVAERDAKLRGAALTALMVVFQQEGPRLWQLLGESLPATQLDPVRERSKIVERTLAKSGLVPGDVEPTKAPRSRSPSKAVLASSRPGSSTHQRENGHTAHRTRSPATTSPSGAPRAAPFVPRLPSPSTSPTRPVGALQTLPMLPADHAGTTAHAAATAAGAAMAARAASAAALARTSGDDILDRANVSPAPSLDAAAPRIGYSQSYQFARNDLLQNPSSGCVESIKLIYWTLSSLGDGPEANAPVDAAAVALIEATINDVTLQLMSRTLILSNLATTLALANGTNPLRPMRYLMNCILKIWETKLSNLLETQTVTLVTREVLSQLTNHRHIQVTFGTDGAALLRLLNMIMLKILDESSLPSIFAALLRAMLAIPDIVTTSGPHQVHCFQALAVKCLTKITKTRLAEEQYPLDEVLLSLHNYFATLGSVEVRRLSQENDKPLRMVKTVLHTLCKIYGYRVTRTLEEMPDIRSLNGQAMIVMYAEINLRSLVDLGMIAAAPSAAASPESVAARPATPSPVSPGSGSPGAQNGAAAAAAAAAAMVARTSPSSRSGRSSGGASPLPPTAPRPASPAAPQPAPAAAPTAAASPAASAPLSPGRAAAADAEAEEDDLAAQPDHFLNRIARRSTAEPLQSSNAVNMAAGSAGPAMGDDLREKVMETFNKIGAASTTHLGLETLYNLLEEHPAFPVEDLLARTSEPFRNYIDKGLHKIHRKRVKMRKRNRTPPAPQQRFTLSSVPEGSSSLRTSANSGQEAPLPDDQLHLRERLQRLEAAAALQARGR
eukprot:jgi/Ulvmu1/11389/UM075_0051.1